MTYEKIEKLLDSFENAVRDVERHKGVNCFAISYGDALFDLTEAIREYGRKNEDEVKQ